MELIINLKEFEPTCQSTLEKVFRTSASLPENFPEKIQLLGQQIFRDILFQIYKEIENQIKKTKQKKKKIVQLLELRDILTI